MDILNHQNITLDGQIRILDSISSNGVTTITLKHIVCHFLILKGILKCHKTKSKPLKCMFLTEF